VPEIALPHQWDPRPYQMPGWMALHSQYKRFIFLWHRRAGKDSVCMNFTAEEAMSTVGNYWHMLPTAVQARKVVWDGIDPNDGMRYINRAFPEEIRAGTNSTEMKIELISGSIWQLCGSDNYDSLVGSNPLGVVFSEFPLSDPQAWDYIRPILAENGGWALFPFTPRGRNHGYRLFEAAKKNKNWFVQRLDVNDTTKPLFRKGELQLDTKGDPIQIPVIAQEAIQEDRDSGMPEELIEQEYFVSFDAPLVGSYYGEAIRRMRKEGRIGFHPYDSLLKVHTAWDIGTGDATSITFFQVLGAEIRIIDYYENSGKDVAFYINYCRGKPYIYGRAIAPHDIKNRTWVINKTATQIASKLGWEFEVLPRLSIEQGINAVRAILPRIRINVADDDSDITSSANASHTGCTRLVDALGLYRKEWDDEQKVFRNKPVHDWTSNPCDSIRYLALGFREELNIKLPHAPQTIGELTGVGQDKKSNTSLMRL
jgi:phage terminase large subunit